MPERTDTEEMRHCGAAEVVVSGLSGRLPESDNIAEFREHLINGDDMITDDDRRWEPGEHNLHKCLSVYCIQSKLTFCVLWDKKFLRVVLLLLDRIAVLRT